MYGKNTESEQRAIKKCLCPKIHFRPLATYAYVPYIVSGVGNETKK